MYYVTLFKFQGCEAVAPGCPHPLRTTMDRSSGHRTTLQTAVADADDVRRSAIKKANAQTKGFLIKTAIKTKRKQQ